MSMKMAMAAIAGTSVSGSYCALSSGKGPDRLPLMRKSSSLLRRGSLLGTKLVATTSGHRCDGVVKFSRASPVAVMEERKAQAGSPGNSFFVSEGSEDELADQILSGEFSVENGCANDTFSRIRQKLLLAGPVGRFFSFSLAKIERKWRLHIAGKMPEASGDVGRIVGQPFFMPLYSLFLTYGGVFRLTFGPKAFVIVSDPSVAKWILKDNSKGYSKGILAEILEFVMGTGLIPADGEIWKVRRRAIVPSLHKTYVTAMVRLFGQCSSNLCDKLYSAASNGEEVEMESLFSRMTLDVIGKAVFNYEFNSLSVDTGIVEAVYVALREAEDRSVAIFPYWKIPILAALDPRQRKVKKALNLVNETLDVLIAKCKRMVDEEDIDFGEEYISERDPSILHFLLAAGDEVTSKQLRDDLMTLLIAGHETSAAVLTWTFYLLAKNPIVTSRLQMQVDEILGDREPTIEDIKKLTLATNVINESMRLYPQPPVLIRRSLQNDMLGKFRIQAGEDIFISTWNLHRSPHTWDEAAEFKPDRWDTYSAAEASQAFRYLPFGGGPRKCVGDVFAMYETVTALVMLVRRFDFQLPPGGPPITMTTGATIHTGNGLHMCVTHRTKVPVIIPEGSDIQREE